MESSQAAGVKEFLAQESAPKKLLSRVPWKLVDDCAKADAVARIYFAPVNVHELMAGRGGTGTAVGAWHAMQPVLLLYDKASIRLFYRAEGQVFRGDEVDMLRSPFSTLVGDLKKIDR
jgi:hypothetical protein